MNKKSLTLLLGTYNKKYKYNKYGYYSNKKQREKRDKINQKLYKYI